MSKGPVNDGNPTVIALVKSHPTHWIKLCPDKNDQVGLLSIITLLYYTNSLLFTCISMSV